MAAEDDDKPRKKITQEIGQDLSLLSAGDIEERITVLAAEIERLKAKTVIFWQVRNIFCFVINA